jgi:hypothetical protein
MLHEFSHIYESIQQLEHGIKRNRNGMGSRRDIYANIRAHSIRAVGFSKRYHTSNANKNRL